MYEQKVKTRIYAAPAVKGLNALRLSKVRALNKSESIVSYTVYLHENTGRHKYIKCIVFYPLIEITTE